MSYGHAETMALSAHPELWEKAKLIARISELEGEILAAHRLVAMLVEFRLGGSTYVTDAEAADYPRNRNLETWYDPVSRQSRWAVRP